MTAMLELRGITQRFGATTVLQGVDLAIRAGERVALIGPNGAGKSTLFNLVSGRHRPTTGSILLQGQRIDGLRPEQIHRRGLSRSFQQASVFGRLSVFDNLRCAVLGHPACRGSLWRRLRSMVHVNHRADEMLHLLGLASRRTLPAADLSYAEQRALEIGLAVAGGAQVLLLDEPTAGMGHNETAQFIERIRTLSAGRTLLMVEHDMGVVFGLAQRVAVLVRGELLAFDTPEAVRADPRVQEAYLGALPPVQARPDASA
jgi:branched-chain amino acid transport system ATP-binding protein